MNVLLIVAAVLVLLLAVGATVYFSSKSSSASTSAKEAKKDKGGDTKKKATLAGSADGGPLRIQVDDLAEIYALLSPTSSHLDVLYSVITSKEIVDAVSNSLEEIEELKVKKRKKKAEEEATAAKQETRAFDDLMNQDGWDEDGDDDDDEATKEAKRNAKEEEDQKKADMERLMQATGQKLPLLEGIDEGVLGQVWVEKTLAAKGAWPLKLRPWLKKTKFDYKGKKLGPMEHPAVRRILCMTAGRLHSGLLNSHEELMVAGQKKLIDQTYFKASMLFRNRIGVLLEASLRVALAFQSYRIFSTVVETSAMFKIGCQRDDLPWFNGIMARQFNTLPRLAVSNASIEKEVASDNEAIEAGQQVLMSMTVDRTHTEQFVKVKVAMAQKQGIPPQAALQASREAWWFLLRCQRIDGPAPTAKPIDVEAAPVLKRIQELNSEAVEAFKAEPDEQRLKSAWPMMIQNVAQKSGTVKIKVKAPEEPGKYRFVCAIKSQDFLGADQEVSIEIDVVEAQASEPDTTEAVKKAQ
jgi:hypothetical protein